MRWQIEELDNPMREKSNNKFSVLISVYENDSPEYFNEALCSIWDEQTLKPDEIVLVQDGPVGSVKSLSHIFFLGPKSSSLPEQGCFIIRIRPDFQA